jgi:hypothetical protein
MHKRVVLQAFCGLILTAGLVAGTPLRVSADEGDCSAADALSKLPNPLSRWGQIVCTPHGQVITGHSGWVWLQPADHALVAISATFSDDKAPADDAHPYFTKAEVTKVSGEEFDKVYGTFHDGFDPNEEKPVTYRLDLTTESGRTLRMYFFDYFSYGWGMTCPDGQCSRDSRFMMLDMNERPKELAPPI